MALDGIYIYSILCELKDKFIGSRISKINQPEKDELNFLIRGVDNKNYRLLISASSSYPKIHITKNNKTNPLTPPMFCMVLRKYLLNGRIVDIRQVSTDRIIIFDFESVDDLGFNSIYSLVVEIMGRHSNITLIRQRDNIIMDSIKHITPEINRFRSLYPGIKYVYPPKSERLNPFDFNKSDFTNYLTSNAIDIDEKMFSKIFTGVSKPLSKEVFFRLSKNIKMDNINSNDIYEYIANLFNDIKNYKFSYNAYSENGIIKDFSCIDLTNLSTMDKIEYNSSSELLENFYFEKDRADRLNNHSVDLQRIVNTNLDRCLKKDQILSQKLLECETKDKYRLYGELLTSNIYSIKKGEKNVTLQNYYSENLENITITLNENKTPSENIQKYFKKYNKLKTTEKMAKIQLEANSKEMEYLQSVFTNIKNCEDYNEIEEIKKELIETGYIKFNNKNKKKSSKTSKPYHFTSSDGIDIYVGKNNFQNDYLTLKFADKRDIWMHTKNIPGSHVIVKKLGPVPDKTLEEAAGLAAYYSKAKHSNNVAVDYTEVKNVKKPSGAKPGMVIYLTNKTINIMPKKLVPNK
ncbi:MULTISPECIES: NFACT RNA binding domain-containing protein [Clostridium]|uniref:Rqc2 family fibronectin-binding protein n=1 Tax=Clostridium TaxID=1485 RepID=UPI0002890697|nr:MULTISPECIES: NFACT RNA binding domain-containing protein [Clostridium]MDF2504026.1 putative RNA-binding protein snRNP like protein [Clostridium sp.]